MTKQAGKVLEVNDDGTVMVGIGPGPHTPRRDTAPLKPCQRRITTKNGVVVREEGHAVLPADAVPTQWPPQ